MLVTADRLITDRAGKKATFSGRVKVVRGQSTIEADRLTVYYDEKAPRDEGLQPGRSAIERAVAEGSVKIKTKDLTALTPKATYNRNTQKIELLGAGTRVISGNNSITGAKIVLQLEGEKLTVSGEGGEQVKAILKPSDKN